jgi:hypothetical protein
MCLHWAACLEWAVMHVGQSTYTYILTYTHDYAIYNVDTQQALKLCNAVLKKQGNIALILALKALTFTRTGQQGVYVCV